VLDAGLVTTALIEGIQEYDRTLIDDLVCMFPKGYDEDWAQWDDADDSPNNVFSVIGVKGDEDFDVARRAVVGTTALVAFIDEKGENIWVASLGDSEASTLLVSWNPKPFLKPNSCWTKERSSGVGFPHSKRIPQC